MDMLAPALNVSALSSKSGDQRFYLTMLLIAVPFALIGIHLTLNRLRSADMPRWLVVLFFVPVVNLLYFVVLACMPPRSHHAAVGGAVDPVTASATSSTGKPIRLEYGVEASIEHG